jgi:glutathione S-transferase
MTLSRRSHATAYIKADPVLLRVAPRRKLPVAVLPDGSVTCESTTSPLFLLETFGAASTFHPAAPSANFGHTCARFLQAEVRIVAESCPPVAKLFMFCFRTPKDKRGNKAIEAAIKSHNKPEI